jgi:hypothetical protein
MPACIVNQLAASHCPLWLPCCRHSMQAGLCCDNLQLVQTTFHNEDQLLTFPNEHSGFCHMVQCQLRRTFTKKSLEKPRWPCAAYSSSTSCWLRSCKANGRKQRSRHQLLCHELYMHRLSSGDLKKDRLLLLCGKA